MTETTPAKPWEIMREGIWEPATEDELKLFIRRMGAYSDSKGVCSHVMSQMLAEIERLRAEAEAHNTPAWEANELLNRRADICYQALERIIAEGPPEQYERIARQALKDAADVI